MFLLHCVLCMHTCDSSQRVLAICIIFGCGGGLAEGVEGHTVGRLHELMHIYMCIVCV